MFKKLRRQIIISVSTIGIAAFAVLFGALFYFNYLITEQNIKEILDDSLERAVASPAARYNQRLNCPILEFHEDDTVITFGFNAYSDDEITTIVNTAAGLEEPRGKFRANGTTYYYAEETGVSPFNGEVRLVAVYDVSVIKDNLRAFSTTIAIAFLCCAAIIIVASIPIADNIVRPTSDAWDKQHQLVTNASHELKTPITIIDTNLTALAEVIPPDEESKKWMDNISCQTKRMNTLVCEMLELSRYDSGENAAISEVNVSELVDGVALSYEAATFEKGIVLDTDIEPNVLLQTNPDLLSKVVYILADNALKYTNKDNKIYVSVKTDKKRCFISFNNTGVGIAPDSLEKIFDRFFREDKVRSQNGQSSFGLGLAIARSACQRIGADIRALSDGTTYAEFVVTLYK